MSTSIDTPRITRASKSATSLSITFSPDSSSLADDQTEVVHLAPLDDQHIVSLRHEPTHGSRHAPVRHDDNERRTQHNHTKRQAPITVSVRQNAISSRCRFASAKTASAWRWTQQRMR